MTRPARMTFLRALAVFVAAILSAQTLGTLHGVVLDPSGAAVPNASVTASGPNNVVKVVQTDVSGAYTIAGLMPGKYTIRVIAAGFNVVERADVDISAGRPVTLDAHLIVAAEKQEVTVADTQQVELDPAKNAGALVLKETDLDMLPDDPDDLQADLLALAGPAAGPNGGQMYIDGFSNGQLPPKESIREIRINSNPFSSEFDAPGYGRIEILTKPGSDKLRGMIEFHYSDSIWNARNPYAPQKPFYDTKFLNGNLSGPILKNKMSFFLDFNRRDMRDSDLINAQLLPSLNFAQSVIAPSQRTSVSPRIDYQLTPNITLQGRYSWVQQNLSNQGIGGINLAAGAVLPPSVFSPANTSTAYSQSNTNQTIQLTETQVINTATINETRFQYYRQRQNQTGDNPILNVQVNDEFAFGSSFPLQYNNQNNYELQNYTSITHGTQFFKFGTRLREGTQASYSTTNFTGQYIFDSLADYQAGAAAQYIVAGGNPLQNVKQFDAGLFFQDDWKVKPSLTLSLGTRYEIQQNISDHGDLAPRVGLAWGIGPGQGRLRQPKTVLRGGYGWFYSRFPVGYTLQSERDNGVNQLQYIVQSPCFYPNAPTITQVSEALSSCSGSGANPSLATTPLNIYKVDANLHAGLLMQSAIGIDRQLPKNTTLSVNFINSRGIHQFRTVNINTPLPAPGTNVPAYSLANPGAAVYPYSSYPIAGTSSTVGNGVLDLYESSGTFRQNQLIFNVNSRLSSRITLFGFYAYGHAHTDVLGQPSNPYNFAADWGRSSYDIRHRLNINGSIVLPFGLRLSPNISASSAPPFNITTGVDQYGDSLFNARPALVPQGFTGPACTAQVANAGVACIVSTAKYGSFVINPLPGMTVIPANYGVGFAQVSFNLRISRTWGFGESVTANPNQNRRGGGFGGPGRGGFGGGRGPGGPPPGGGFFGGGDTSGKRYSVTLSLYVRNIFNTVNPALPESDLLSARFGETLALSTAGQGATQSANRRMEINLRFAF